MKSPVVAVASFENLTASGRTDFLSSVLAQAFSDALSTMKGIKQTERAQIDRLLAELGLSQLGILEDGSGEKLKLLPADFLAIGSYSGSTSALEVGIRLVDSKTGEIRSQKNLSGSMEDIMAGMPSVVSHFRLALLGGASATLNVISKPEGAQVFVDNILVGRTPLMNFVLSTGLHQLKILAKNHRPEDREIMAEENATLDLSFELTNSKVGRGFVVGVMSGMAESIPEELDRDIVYFVSFGHIFRRFRVGLELGGNPTLDHSYTYPVPYGRKSETRYYTSFQINARFHYYLMDHPWFSPYGGMTLGALWLWDNSVLSAVNEHKVDDFRQPLLGLVAGARLFSDHRFNFIAELRYSRSLTETKRTIVISQGSFGDATASGDNANRKVDEFFFETLSFVAGIQVILW